jgi:predicted negative regulator of RcsB-dependent stress response
MEASNMTGYAVFLVVILALLLACVILFCIAKTQVKRADKAEQESSAYRKALEEVRGRAARMRETLAKEDRIEEEANHEKQALAGTPDRDLVGRANSLFRVPDGSADQR